MSQSTKDCLYPLDRVGPIEWPQMNNNPPGRTYVPDLRMKRRSSVVGGHDALGQAHNEGYAYG